MPICTFFGHRDCPDTIKPKLRAVLVALIERRSVNSFYVGNKGAFDRMVLSVLRELTELYPHIQYAVVLERLPVKCEEGCTHTILPEGMETVPPRFAIDRRNRWMLEHGDTVVCYVTHGWGGAAKYTEMAERQKKTVINLYDSTV